MLSAHHAPAPRPRVLIVEDHDDTREMYAQFLTAISGLDVIECASSATALTQALAAFPDVVVTDYLMPKFNGIELCRQLQANPATSRIPVIMLTADAHALRSESVLALCAAVVLKPCEPEDLALHIRTVIGQGERTPGVSAAT